MCYNINYDQSIQNVPIEKIAQIYRMLEQTHGAVKLPEASLTLGIRFSIR